MAKMKFIPPTLEQVRAYKQEANLTCLKSEEFFEYFTLANWIDSKGNKVKNWKNKAITWHLQTRKKLQLHSDIIQREERARKEKILHSKPLPRDLTANLFNMPKEPIAKPMWQQKQELLKKETVKQYVPLTAEQLQERKINLRKLLQSEKDMI